MSEQQQPARAPDMSIFEPERPKLSRLIGWRQVTYVVAILTNSYLAFGPPLSRTYSFLPRHDLDQFFFLGFYGLIPGITVLFIWGVTWLWKSRPHALFATVISLYVIVFILGAFMFPQPAGREPSRRGQCKNNLKQIGLALHTYHDDYGTFPPAFIADENGEPMHSWRVLLLPYLDQKNWYEEYNFGEPWNSPSNQRLAERVMSVYRCPSHRSEQRTATTYHILVGGETMWPGEKGVAIDEITDGVENTLAVVEINQREVSWLDPRPVTAKEFLELYETPIDNDDLPHAEGTHMLHADGAVRFMSWYMSAKYWQYLLTKSAGDTLPESAMEDRERARRQSTFRWKNWRQKADEWFAAAFVMVALLPLPWVWITPGKNQAGEAS